MIQQYVPPTKWYRREHSIVITIWPSWLSQLICSHDFQSKIGTTHPDGLIMSQCQDCYKFILTKPINSDVKSVKIDRN